MFVLNVRNKRVSIKIFKTDLYKILNTKFVDKHLGKLFNISY